MTVTTCSGFIAGERDWVQKRRGRACLGCGRHKSRSRAIAACHRGEGSDILYSKKRSRSDQPCREVQRCSLVAINVLRLRALERGKSTLLTRKAEAGEPIRSAVGSISSRQVHVEAVAVCKQRLNETCCGGVVSHSDVGLVDN